MKLPPPQPLFPSVVLVRLMDNMQPKEACLEMQDL